MALKLCNATRISLYVAIDKSESMLWGTTDWELPTGGDPSRIDIVKAAMADVLDQLKDAVTAGLTLDIAINFWATSATVQKKPAATVADLTALQTFVADMTLGDQNTTNFDKAVSGTDGAVNWFTGTAADAIDRRIFIFITDGVPAPAGTDDTAATTAADLLDTGSGTFNTGAGTDVEMFGFNILLADTTHTAKLDNTAADGVPVLETLDSDELQTLLAVDQLCILTSEVGNAVFFRLDTDPPLRLWCGINDIPIQLTNVDAGGAVYLGAGRLLNVPDLEVLINGIADRVEFYLPGVSVENSNRVAAGAPAIQGAAVHVGLATLDDRYQPTTEITPVWYGLADLWAMKQPKSSDPSQPPARTLVLSVGSGRTGRARARRAAYTSVQQKLLYPDDKFCDFVSRYTTLYEVKWPVF